MLQVFSIDKNLRYKYLESIYIQKLLICMILHIIVNHI